MIDEDILERLTLERKIEVSENIFRKSFTFSEMCEVIDATISDVKEKAKKRMKSGQPSSDSDKGRTDEKISNLLGVSRDKYHKILNIKDAIKNNPKEFGDIPKRIEKGMSIEYASKMVNTARKADTPTPNLPSGVFEAIVCDPPWKYAIQLEGAPDYKTMSLEEMKEQFPTLPVHRDSILFMWATNPKLKEAIELMTFWEFEYKTNIVWVKQKNKKLQTGVGHYVKGSHELLLIGTRGSPGVPKESERIASAVLSPRTTHSEKPRIFSRIIEKYYPKKKKLEMFARKEDPEDDGTWTYWGDSIESNKTDSD